MARPIGPRKIYRYSEEFRATAVRLSELAGARIACSAATGLALGFVGGLTVAHVLQLDEPVLFAVATFGAAALGWAVHGFAVRLERHVPRFNNVWYLTAPVALALVVDVLR